MSALVLAVPSKGRLQESAAAVFARAGLAFVQSRGSRDYRARIAGLESVEVAFLSAGEIAKELALGTVHLGITGADLLHEGVSAMGERVHLVTPLGFGQANVVVAVPQAWIDVSTMDDLDDVAAEIRARTGRRLRVATKYVSLTRAHFARHRVADYRIVESVGATEGAPASGVAEAIVDITTTGATLAANGLKVLEDGLILRSEAHLVASLGASWGETQRLALSEILNRVAAEETARRTREVQVSTGRPEPVAEAARERLGAAASITVRDRLVVLRVGEDQVFGLVGFVRGLEGIEAVGVYRAEAVFERENPMLQGLLERLGP